MENRTKDELIELGIYTNDKINLFERFKDIIEQGRGEYCLYAVVGYFYAGGYYPLRDHIRKLKSTQVLIGIESDFVSAHWHSKAHKEKHTQTLKALALKNLCQDIEKAHYLPQMEEGLKSFVEDVLEGKIELRFYDKKKLHAKFYLFIPQNWNTGFTSGTLITGSSNFTAPGLGSEGGSQRTNYELNIERREAPVMRFARGEFDRLWAESVPLEPTEIQKTIETKTFLNKTITPRDFYLRFLYEVFKDNIETDLFGVEDQFQMGFKRLSYQIDAVNEGLDLLKRYNGFFLADVVGLGKTVVGTLLIKTSISKLENHAKILIVCPPILKENWKRTLEAFNVNPRRWEIVSSGSLHHVEQPQRYAMVIVDEAHNFRNSATLNYEKLNYITKGRGDYGIKKVVLISATPLNNEPREILNLLGLFQDTRSSQLDVSDLDSYFNQKQKAFDSAKAPGVSREEARAIVKEIYSEIRELVLSQVTIRRTRADLLENEDYRKDILAQGIRFPSVQKPRIVHYDLDSNLDTLYMDTIEILTQNFTYAYHKHLSFLQGPVARKFVIPEHIFLQLNDLMKRFFLKRLDSSFFAFRESLQRFSNNNQAFIKMIKADRVFLSISVDVNEYISNDDLDGLMVQLEEHKTDDPTITVCGASDFKPEFLGQLESDQNFLQNLLIRWNSLAEDPKALRFANELDIWLRETVNPGRKIVVFSESQDTVEMLARELKKAGRKDVLAISASNRQDNEDTIRRNFDANHAAHLKDDVYRVLIATDVLAEGVNLHRANTVVNYDTPWNSVRLFQRVGRVNRVGSVADQVFIYNFFPVSHVDDQIELRKKAEMKLQAFHSAFGEDAPIYSSDEEVGHYGLFNSQDWEDDEGSNPRTKLMMEIRSFKQKYPEDFQRIAELPSGLRCLRFGTKSSSIAFLRSQVREAFYTVDDQGAKQISLVEASDLLRADEKEKALDKSYPWNKTYDSAAELFLRKEALNVQHNSGAKAYRNDEQVAMKFLGSFLDLFDDEELGVSPELILRIRRARDLIKNGGAPIKLIRDIAASFQNNSAKPLQPQALLDHVKKLLEPYMLDQEISTPGQTELDPLEPVEPPTLVLTEAFILGESL